ncbi:clasp N terminal-domain-containing protein [Cytidiella melzeri]|nr:clasp N terminal-domain-containing protein [Cytidiella melzeri]
MDSSQIERLINQCRSNGACPFHPSLIHKVSHATFSDVDVKVDAVTKLQAEFESGAEIPDPDALLTALKTCLRTPNQHLTTATLSALPPLLPLLIARNASNHPTQGASISPAASTSSLSPSTIDAYTLRQALHALLPSGGVIDRLGDARDRPREKARETLALLGGYAFRFNTASSSLRAKEGKGPETPLMMFEKFLREGGFGSKVARVREQAILTLVHIRRTHHMFPIRPYLPGLVESLEDSDPAVRETAKTSVVELFTGPGVTDAARADLKKEMGRKGVRKGIVELLLGRILAGASGTTPVGSEAGSENGDAVAYVPLSVALAGKKTVGAAGGSSMSRSVSQPYVDKSRPASRNAAAPQPPTAGFVEGLTGGAGVLDVKSVYIVSSRDLENEFASMLKHFEGKETEHNWAPREKAILRVRGMLKGDVHERFMDTFLHGLKNGFMDASLKTLASLRTTVAANTISMYCELATTLGTAMDPFCDAMYTHLIRMGSLTKKVIAQQSQAAVDTIIHSVSPQPRLVLPVLWNALQDKAPQTRVYAMGHVKVYLEVNGSRGRHSIESVGGVDTLEKCLKKALGDANPGTRETARQAFWIFDGVWRDRGRALMETLDSTSKKQLEKACPSPELLAGLQAVTVQTPSLKKQSVAAAIAASRAKAKAIATAPPSLRHQATSQARTTSPPTKPRAASPSLSNSQSTGAVRAASPNGSPPRSRILTGGGGTMARAVSSSFVPNRDAARVPLPESPPSPTPDSSTFRRRVSSPMALSSNGNGNAVLRRAAQTALPASPPPRSVRLHANAHTLSRGGQNLTRESVSVAGMMQENDNESLLLASNVPIPEDSDSEMEIDDGFNLISFSTPYELYPPGGGGGIPQTRSAASFSPRSSSSRPPLSNALSTGTSSPPAGVPQPMVEDAMRARAEQAESAAERLLELVVDPEEGGVQPLATLLPSSLLLSHSHSRSAAAARVTTASTTSRMMSRPSAGGISSLKSSAAVPQPQPQPQPPRTPVSKSSNTVNARKVSSLFQDSPVYNRKAASSIFDMMNGQGNDDVWWNKRMSLFNERPMIAAGEGSERKEESELNGYIAALEAGLADVLVLKKLALVCRQNPVNEPISPISPDFSDPASPSPLLGTGRTRTLPSLKTDLWHQDRTAERLFNVLVQYLDPARPTTELEYGLIVLWELLESQAPLLEGREADVFSVLLQVRYSGHPTVMQATTTFRDTLTSRIEPVYGLTTMHACIQTFRDTPLPPLTDVETKNGTYAFGLIALGKFIMRLPAEVLEDELPRLRATLTSALTDMTSDSSLVVREAAAASIIAAQLVLQDEGHLFALLAGLPEDKKNLLAYLFDKHGCRSSASSNGKPPKPVGVEKLEREMRRLDNRTSLPPRPSGGLSTSLMSA